ncbi:MAG: hypothetical protein JW747_10050 [Candidatus Aminicenantes bacterium]|nr:hypothetical protein [Candidatus Aminicenantes bacterium]
MDFGAETEDETAVEEEETAEADDESEAESEPDNNTGPAAATRAVPIRIRKRAFFVGISFCTSPPGTGFNCGILYFHPGVFNIFSKNPMEYLMFGRYQRMVLFHSPLAGFAESSVGLNVQGDPPGLKAPDFFLKPR